MTLFRSPNVIIWRVIFTEQNFRGFRELNRIRENLIHKNVVFAQSAKILPCKNYLQRIMGPLPAKILKPTKNYPQGIYSNNGKVPLTATTIIIPHQTAKNSIRNKTLN